MTDVRPAAVAGGFYPGDPGALRANVTKLLDDADVTDPGPLGAAYVVPHAGYRYSGPVAAQVYARLRHHRGQINHVVLVGPSHFVRLTGVALSPVDAWATPLGQMSLINPEWLSSDAACHEREHALEVQLPFVIESLGEVTITPIAVGMIDPAEMATTLDSLMGPDVLLLCSTDLSHYHDQLTAQRLDQRTADAVMSLKPSRIGIRDACGVFALRGTVAWAARRGLRPSLLDLRTSADTVGGPDRVVGYPAFAFA